MLCKFCNKSCKNSRSHKNHEKTCPQNPNRLFRGYRAGLAPWNKGLTLDSEPRMAASIAAMTAARKGLPAHKWSEESLAKVSISMKRAHAEGRAHNIGQSRWNNEPSYPEKFFMEVIANEFNDKDYIYEYPIGIFSIDFAWASKRKAIEIDGKQHEQPEYQARDIRKNKFLEDSGWDLLRVKWADFFNNPSYWIQTTKRFIEGNS